MKPHKHAELIKAWADGAIIQYSTYGELWFDDDCPEWNDDSVIFRIKPEPKPDVVTYCALPLKTELTYFGFAMSPLKTKADNLKLIWDGETGKLKSSEVLK
jgi:hypothetical protein